MGKPSSGPSGRLLPEGEGLARDFVHLESTFFVGLPTHASPLLKIHTPFILLKSIGMNLPAVTLKEMIMELLTSIPVRLIGFESTPQLLDDVRGRIAQKAYLNFMDRGAINGYDLDDWLRAEHELIIRPVPKIEVDAENVFIELELPEMEMPNLTVRLASRQLVVSSDPNDQSVQICLMIELPLEISMDSVDAEQLRNVLQITASAAASEPEGKMAASRCA